MTYASIVRRSQHPGQFPGAVEHAVDGKTETAIEPVHVGTDIQATFFDMWRQDHADADLQPVPADMVMTSGSGLDPHITLDNALFQLDGRKRWGVVLSGRAVVAGCRPRALPAALRMIEQRRSLGRRRCIAACSRG